MIITMTPIQATDYCVSRTEAKAFLRIDTTDDDTLIDGLIAGASDLVEHFTGRTLLTKTKELYLSQFQQQHQSNIPLPYPPLQSVSSITYVDGNGTTQTLNPAIYQAAIHTLPGCIRLKHGQSYPNTRGDTDNICITYIAGYGTSDNVPEGLKTAIKLLVGNWYENREATSPLTMKEVPFGIECLLWQYRVISL